MTLKSLWSLIWCWGFFFITTTHQYLTNNKLYYLFLVIIFYQNIFIGFPFEVFQLPSFNSLVVYRVSWYICIMYRFWLLRQKLHSACGRCWKSCRGQCERLSPRPAGYIAQIVSAHGRTLPALSIKEQHGEIFSDSLPIKCDCKWLLLLTRPPPRDLINPFGSNLPEKTADDIQGRHSFL